MHLRVTLALLAVLTLASLPDTAVAQCRGVEDLEATALALEADQLARVDLDGAIAKYEAAAHRAPGDHVIWSKLAVAYEKKERWLEMASACASAAAAAEKAEGRKTHADYYLRWGRAIEALAGQALRGWGDARPPLETAIAIDPNLAEAYGELGWTLLHLNDDAGALQSWTTAVVKAPTQTRYYAWLADLYSRLRMLDRAASVAREGLSFASPDDRDVYTLHALLGAVLEARHDEAGAVSEYEAARAACSVDSCRSHPETYFDVGRAYGLSRPPRKTEALQSLQSFWKLVCKGTRAARFSAQCTETSEIANRLGGALQ
jgi:tetratricopeptide (TPR) repeat protein